MKKEIKPLKELTQYSHARIGLGHSGGHLKTKDWLDFQAGFAQAKDAVNSHFDLQQLQDWCAEHKLKSLCVQSQASNLATFLMRPDLGKLLTLESEYELQKQPKSKDVAIVISGGLSPLAIENHATHFLNDLIPALKQNHWSFAPIIIVPCGRVALGDAINHFLKSKVVVMLIGERPGLTTPDSLGIYITHNAKPGCTDAERSCISNIHAQGMHYSSAVKNLVEIMQKAINQGFTGITHSVQKSRKRQLKNKDKPA